MENLYQLTEEPSQLQVVLSSSKAKIPTRGTEGSVGYDLYAIEGITIPKKKQ
jgi:dUTPase